MMISLFLCFVFFAILSIQSKKVEDKVYFEIKPDSNPYLLAKESCQNEYPNCMSLAVPAIQLYQFEKFHIPLKSFKYEDEIVNNDIDNLFDRRKKDNDDDDDDVTTANTSNTKSVSNSSSSTSTSSSTSNQTNKDNEEKKNYKPILNHHHDYVYNWQYNSLCHCMFPGQPVQKPGVFQYFHIPKCGTSINFFLHDYFDNCSTSTTVPCPKWLSEPGEYRKGLCNGRLFSCGGHIVSEDFVSVSLSSPTNLITILRHPFSRLRSMFFHILNNPETEILKPDINITELLMFIQLPTSYSSSTSTTTELLSSSSSLVSASFIRFIQYPGISNCMTKMLNGLPCGAITTTATTSDNTTIDTAINTTGASTINTIGTPHHPKQFSSSSLSLSSSSSSVLSLNLTHIYNAKEILQSMLYFGLTEYFQTSICQLSWLYGNNVKLFHFQTFRQGKYNKKIYSYNTLLPTQEDKNLLLKIEEFDFAVYNYAKQVFFDRLKLTGCPIIDL